MWTDIAEIIKAAELFKCCPHCGSMNIEGHSCDDCEKSFVHADDAYWFSEYLQKKLEKTIRMGEPTPCPNFCGGISVGGQECNDCKKYRNREEEVDY